MWRKLSIEPQEWRLVGWAGGVLALAGWADVSVQNAAETLFLKRVGVAYLPLAFLVSSLLLVLTTAGLVRLVSTRDRADLLPRVFAALALVLIPIWAAIRAGTPGAIPLLVLLSIQIKAIALVVFWVVLGDLLHARQAKRLLAPLMAGLTLGAMFGSFVSDPVGRALGIEGLLPFASGVLVAAALASLPLRRMRPARLDRGLGEEASRTPAPIAPLPDSPERMATFRELWRESRLFRLLLVSATSSGLLGTLLYLQFQFVADQATGGAQGEERLLGLYAQLRGWLNGLVLLAQIGLSSRLYGRIGVPLASAISPLVYLLGFVGLGVQPSLLIAITAIAAARVQDHAVYDPAQRILFNLFPEALRSRATGLLAGPIKRLGGALGNVAWLLALALGGAAWVSSLGLAVAAFWLGSCLLLWRRYSSLLMEETASRVALGDGLVVEDMLDPATLAELGRELLDPDPVRCRTAIELVSVGPRDGAVDTLASAARRAHDSTRPLLVAALDRLLEVGVTSPLHRPSAARDVKALLDDGEGLDERDRADLVQAYGRLASAPEDGADRAVFERALADSSSAVRLAAHAALHSRGVVAADALDQALVSAVHGGDDASRRTAREEFRAILLCSRTDDTWEARLHSLADLLASPEDRVETAEALAEIAARHGPAAAPVAESVLSLRDDPDPRLRAAILRYAGHAGLAQQAPWIVEHVASEHRETTAAARDALLALGPQAADALLIEHCFGRRSTRDAILSLVRELEVDTETLRDLYRRELDWIRHTLVMLHAISDGEEGARRRRSENGEGRAPEIVVQRLQERMDEGLHTALLFLTAIHDEDRIAELDDLLRRTQGVRQHAILLEALESFLTPKEKSQLLPLFDSRSLAVRAGIAASGLRVRTPTFEEARRALLDDPDELTREIAVSTFSNGSGVVAGRSIGKDGVMLSPVEIALQIRSIPLFERLSTRQLLDLAAVVHEESYPAGSVVFEEGDDGTCMYFIVDGEVEIRQGDVLRATLGARGWFGEMAVFDGVTRSATVVTTGPTQLIRLERHDLLSVMEELPSIAIGICQSLSRRLREVERRP